MRGTRGIAVSASHVWNLHLNGPSVGKRALWARAASLSSGWILMTLYNLALFIDTSEDITRAPAWFLYYLPIKDLKPFMLNLWCTFRAVSHYLSYLPPRVKKKNDDVLSERFEKAQRFSLERHIRFVKGVAGSFVRVRYS